MCSDLFEAGDVSPFIGSLVDKMVKHHNRLKTLAGARTGQHADFLIINEDGNRFAVGSIAGANNLFRKP